MSSVPILVIDDNPASADATARILRESHPEVEIVPTVEAALAALAAATPSLVVLDLKLDSDATALHAALALRGVPVLLTSGIEPARLPEVAGPRGWSYLAKPFDTHSLTAAVDALLGRATGQYRAGVDRVAGGAPSATPKSTGELIRNFILDAAALAVLGTEIIVVRPSNPWIVGGCIAGILLVSGVRASEMVDLTKLLPGRGGGPGNS